MSENLRVANRIYELINAQLHDIVWLFEASKHLGVDVLYLKRDDWDKQFWHNDWGEIERLPQEDNPSPIIAWHRTDGGPSIALIEHPEHVRLVQFALLAEYAKALKKAGRLSYAKVGFPKDWQNCTILVNGMERNHVKEADALAGLCHCAKFDSRGRIVKTVDNMSFAYSRLKGKVEIIINEKPKGFF